MSDWLQRLAPRPNAAVRLFAFHHAGGNAGSFRLWPGRLPELDVCAVQLPGRANRLHETALTCVDDIVDGLLPVVAPLLDRPFAFFGHSMGSAIAWALVERLQARALPLPRHLFVSGRQPPHKPFPEWQVAGRSDAALVDSIEQHFGAFPAEIRTCPELLELLLPALRADFAAIEAYTPAAGGALPIRITALGGASDPCAAPDHLLPWQLHTTHPLRMMHFPGDHFYLDAALDAVVATVRAALSTPAMAGAPRTLGA